MSLNLNNLSVENLSQCEQLVDKMWGSIFTSESGTYDDYLIFVKLVIDFSLSNILRQREILSQQCFDENHVEVNIVNHTLKSSNAATKGFIDMMNHISLFLNDGTVARVEFVISEKPYESKVIERFSWKMLYDDDGPSTILSVGVGENELTDLMYVRYNGTRYIRCHFIILIYHIQNYCRRVSCKYPKEYYFQCRIHFNEKASSFFKLAYFIPHNSYFPIEKLHAMPRFPDNILLYSFRFVSNFNEEDTESEEDKELVRYLLEEYNIIEKLLAIREETDENNNTSYSFESHDPLVGSIQENMSSLNLGSGPR